jgi:hypothetical protein
MSTEEFYWSEAVLVSPGLRWSRSSRLTSWPLRHPT